MPSRRVIVLAGLAATALAAMAVAGYLGGGGEETEPAPQASPKPAHTLPSPTATAALSEPEATGSPAPAGGEALEAVRALKRFCDLVDDGRLRAAGRLLAGPWVWPQRELGVLAHFRLVSARVQREQLGAGVVLLARLRARLRGPSPLHDGVNTLFITLGRDGTTGGWLITAVTSSP